MRIRSTSLVSAETIQFGTFNVFTGGNGVGKTTFLAELYDRTAGIGRNRYYWVGSPSFDSDDVGRDMRLLQDSLARRWEGSSYFFFSSAAKAKDGQVDLDNALRFSVDEAKISAETLTNALFDQIKYRRPFVTYLGCDARLGLPNEVGTVARNQPPQDPVNVLYRNKKLLSEIDQTLNARFQIHFTLLDHIGTQLQLGIARELPPAFDARAENQQSEYERIDAWRANHFTPIQEAGHGIRSMVRLLTGLLEPVNQVILIDEPEMHLAPVQKRWLGKEMVRLAAQQKKQVFLVTHDPIVLQGVLDASTMTTVFRLEREATNQIAMRSCNLDSVQDSTANRNQDQFLQALFYQRSVIVEGATDRSFYQNLIEDSAEIAERDIGFIACSGKGSTKHVAHLASRVGLRVAFIYDLDALFELRFLRDIYKLQGGQSDFLTAFEGALPQDVQRMDESNQKKALKLLTGFREKEGFTSEWAREHDELIQAVILQLRASGIFLVPKGTLEGWAPDVEPKVRFAEVAPSVVRAHENLRKPLEEFLEAVLKYLGVKQGLTIRTAS